MALSANSVVEVRTGGNDTNGGGFVTGAAGTDYSQQNAKNTVGSDISTTDGVGNGTTTFTSATANFGTTIVGNIIYLQGGTGGLAAGWYQVTARASTTSITLDRAVAAGTGITMNIGGALASLGMAGGYGLVSGGIIYVQSGSFTVTSASTNVTGGCFSSSLAFLHIEGYQTSRGDMGTAPVLTASGISTFNIITLTGTSASVYNMSLDGASLTTSRGFNMRGVAYRCRAANFTSRGFFINGGSVTWIRCVATGCSSTPPFSGGLLIECVSYENSISGFEDFTGAIRCISDSNTGATSDGFLVNHVNSVTSIQHCVSYNNGRAGYRVNSNAAYIDNCIAESNAGFGVDVNNVSNVIIQNLGTFSNTGGTVSIGTGKSNINTGGVSGSASFFTDAPNQDFTLNNTSGAGAAARGAGFNTLPIGGTGFPDLGAIQHQDAGSGGGGLRLAGRGGLAAGA